MNVELITKTDLDNFKKEIISEISSLLGQSVQQQKKWLKSAEVRKLLNISPGTLQNLRINGTIQFTKLGGTIYYQSKDIEKLMEVGND